MKTVTVAALPAVLTLFISGCKASDGMMGGLMDRVGAMGMQPVADVMTGVQHAGCHNG
jgi:hypothetical protein